MLGKLRRSDIDKTVELETPVNIMEFIEGMPEDVYVYISCASAAIFCGKVRDFKSSLNLLDYHYDRKALSRKLYRDTQIRNAEIAIKQGKKVKILPPIPYIPHVPFAEHNVQFYRGRWISGEPPMWIIGMDGEEIGEIWLLSEMYDRMEWYQKEWDTKKREEVLKKCNGTSQTKSPKSFLT